MAYYCIATPVIFGTITKNIVQYNNTVPYFAIIYKNVVKIPTTGYNVQTEANLTKSVSSANISVAASYRPVTGQMWPRAAPAVTTRVVEVQTPNPTNVIYLYTTYGGF